MSTAPENSADPRVVFLDRDGTINRPAMAGDYITDPHDLELLPGVGEALSRLKQRGIRLVVVTNQRGIALGVLSWPQLAAIHRQLAAKLEAYGVLLDGIYVCPHGISECACRKPAPGLLLRARAEDARNSFDHAVIIGDAETDIAAGAAVGIPGILLGATPPGPDITNTQHASDLASAVDLFLEGGIRPLRQMSKSSKIGG